MKRRLLELLGLMMIGDGVVSLMQPRRHCLLWKVGPDSCRQMMDTLADHPRFTRSLGLLETVAGMWIASQQEPKRGWVSHFTRCSR